MSTISNVGKVAYIYDQATDTWYPVAGMTDTSADFSWTGDHTFSQALVVNNATQINGDLVLKGSLNHFDSEAQRDTVLPTPTDGEFALVAVAGVLQPQHYYSGAWRVFGSNAFLISRTASHTLAMSDSGKTLDFTSSSGLTVTVPLNATVAFPIGTQIAFIQSGTGQISFVGATASGGQTVTILSKNNNRKTSTQYTQSILVKKDTNTWYLFGDLTA